MTATANATFTAAQFNTYVRDNLNETAPAKATAAGRIFVTTGSNAIAERAISSQIIDTAQTTTSTTFTDLATSGPAVTVTTGTTALVCMKAQAQNNTVNAYSVMGCTISGATSSAATDAKALIIQSSTANALYQGCIWTRYTGLTSGSNTFTLKYRASSNTSTFERREIIVIGL